MKSPRRHAMVVITVSPGVLRCGNFKSRHGAFTVGSAICEFATQLRLAKPTECLTYVYMFVVLVDWRVFVVGEMPAGQARVPGVGRWRHITPVNEGVDTLNNVIVLVNGRPPQVGR